MVWWIITRLGLLSGERVAFHGLGKNRSALATMVVAYGGASAVLWLVAAMMGSAKFVPATFWSGGIYALSFGLYTTALSRGEVGQVSAWANATPVLLFLWHPTGTIWAWVSVMGFLGGALWLGGIGKRFNRGVVLMLFSDVILVLGRLLDIGHVGLEPLAYAASLYLVVTGWMMLASIMFGNMPSVWKMLRERPIWAFAAAVSNGGSYLTLFMLLGMMPVTLIEAVSALAGIGATVVGVFGFHEHDRRRKIIATMVMTLATILLLYDHRGILRVQ